MKKIILSAAVAAMAFSTSAMAADKGIDIDVGGQAVVYYQTADKDGADGDLFDQDNSSANVGIQLDLGADLGNNFTFGSQLTYLGTAGLEKNLVGGVRQTADNNALTNGDDTTSEVALTKIFIAKKIANTTVKIGRQELPKSLSPLAFTEGWNVFKNTFDAILVVNTDIPNTTLVGAYVSGGTSQSLQSTQDLTTVNDTVANLDVDGEAYMITVQNKSIPMATVTATYYGLSNIGQTEADNANTSSISADAYWLDIAIADKSLPMGLKVGLQAGMIDPDDSVLGADIDETKAYGMKVSVAPVTGLTLAAAYTDVDGDDDKVNVAIKNTGTGIKTPLFTQMIANQNAIALDAKTWQLKAAYNTGTFGTFGIGYTDTSAGESNLNSLTRSKIAPTIGNVIAVDENDYNELDVTYKIKAGGVQYFAAYVRQDFEADDSDTDIIRVWARYAF